MPLRTPQEIQQTAFEAGINKAKRPIGRLIVGSVLAGAFIALGGVLSIITGFGLPELTTGNPAVQRIVSGLFFPIGLMLVVVLGADLFTGNNALLVSPLLKRQIGIGTVAKNWCIVWAGNFVGALLVAYFLVYLTGITAAAPYPTALNTIAVAKTSAPWWVVMLKGIGANWCVCLAIWLALSGRHLGEKLLACEIPIMAFVALGFEHCVANMFFLPLAMMQGAPIGIADMMLRNILPATIGNIIGGAILVGLAHDYLQRK